MKRIILFAVAVLVIVAGVVVFALVRDGQNQPSPSQATVETVFYKTQAECESETGKSCTGPLMCDYIPEGKTIDEVCGKGYFKGAWQARQ